jgi:hypothetical protein
LRFFFFGFFGLTGALGVRTVDGEMPPVVEVEATPGLFGPMPPDTPPLVVVLPLPTDGAVVPPVDADAPAAPHASAISTTSAASTARSEFPPCMGLGIGLP